MQNGVSESTRVTLTAPSALVSGEPLVIAPNLFGVPYSDAASGAKVALETAGQLRLDKVSAAIADTPHEAAEAIAFGARVYWDRENEVATGKPLGPFIGVCIEAAASSATKVRVQLRPMDHALSGWTCGWLDGNGGLTTGAHDLEGGLIPAGALPLRYIYKVLRNNFASPTTDGATIALGTEDSAASLKAATAISSGTTWDATGTPVAASAAVLAPTTAERKIRATVAVEGTSNTDSVLVVWVEWILLGTFT
jgi:predicted RecA/RadA family phage recombinase